MGEAGSGKTLVLARLLEEAISLGLAETITVIDMAPTRHGEVGGKMIDRTDAVGKVRYLTEDKIYAPRLMGSSREEVLRYAEQNMRIAEAMLRRYEESPTEMLMINDLSIYLHAGDLGRLRRCVAVASTFIGTAYRGERLGDDKGSGISAKERLLVDELAKSMDRLIEIIPKMGDQQ